MSECECESHRVQIQEPAVEGRMEMMNKYARTGDIPGLYSSIKNDPQLLKDMDEIQYINTPLHEAAAFGQTCFALEILNLTPSFESILALEDVDGNTALHTAVQYQRRKEVKVLVKLVKLNPRNVSLKTPLDIADEYSETADILIHAGARKAKQLPQIHRRGQYLQSNVTSAEDFLRGYYFTYKDFVLNLRNDIMVFAVLIATATYQAVLQPPGGVYQPNGNGHLAMSDALISHMSDGAGKMVMKRLDYRHFMPANTAAFTLSIAMILLVLQGRPSNIFLLLCLIFLTYSYLSAMNIISDSGALTKSMFIICWSVIGSAFFIKLSFSFVKALVDEVWWMPRLSIKVNNSILDRPVGRWLQTNIPIVRKLMRQYHLIKETVPSN
ncbi:hypothetical protein CDL12_18882 [Handroanthus impetiginosus]|uniref:PGG domain-containing protein n=1 Tax=Handroanthus impetiginosus TaxID=429701 RepID=A0A2G9GTC7_9LAMI|nr:hypothetical protein CDL12_18882 [Handroanthus impetiginosus]